MLSKILITIAIIIAVILLLLFILSKRYFKLPVRFLWKLKDIPAVPINIGEVASSLVSLFSRKKETSQAMLGCDKEYYVNIDGIEQEVTAYNLMFGFGKDYKQSPQNGTDIRTRHEVTPSQLALEVGKSILTGNVKKIFGEQDHLLKTGDIEEITNTVITDPTQFAMSWTSVGNVYNRNKNDGFLDAFTETLVNPNTATKEFWPLISEYGMAYNLLIAKKVTKGNKADVRKHIEAHWFDELDEMIERQELYVIDMMFFDTLTPQQPSNGAAIRFTPATLTLLQQDATTKNLLPIAIWVNGIKDKDNFEVEGQFYNSTNNTCTGSAWLYALQAVKVSITVYGIWYGHVYNWHILSAAMQLSLYKKLPKKHPIYTLLEPHSHYLIAFDDILLMLWGFLAPPTSIITGAQFLKAMNDYAPLHSFFADDPHVKLKTLGITEEDFTTEKDKPWNKYKVVRRTTDIWKSVEYYVEDFIIAFYPTDEKVKNDKPLQNWIKYARSTKGGNLVNLPSSIRDKKALKNLLTSILYKIIVHGNSRMNRAANPALSFLANFPPCLQRTHIPKPSDKLTTKQLLTYLPRTGTIGQMNTFYFTFIYSSPYESLIPIDGIDSDLPFPYKEPEKTKSRGVGDADSTVEELVENRYKDEIADYSIYYERPDIDPTKNPNEYVNDAAKKLRKRMQIFINHYDKDSPLINQWPRNIET